MTADSLDQWSQMDSFIFSDIHPVFHTLINFLVTRLWKDPAAVSFFQSICFSLVIAYCFSVFKKLGINKYFLILLAILISINPLVGTMVVTLWKDVLYTINFILLGTLLLEIGIYSIDTFKLKKYKIVLFIISLLSLSMLRQNGILTFLVLFILLIIYFWKNRKFIFNCFAFVMILIYFIRGPFYSYLRVSPSPKTQYYYQTVLFLSNVVKNEKKLTLSQYEVINNLLPYNLWNTYYSPITSWNYFVSEKFNRNYLVNNQKNILLTTKDLVFEYPNLFVSSWFNLNSYILKIKRPSNFYIFPVSVDLIQVESGYYRELEDKYNIHPRFVLPKVREKIIFYIIRFNSSKYLFLLFQPAFFLYINILALFYLLIRKNNWFVITPPILNTISILLSSGSQELRYFYPLIVTTIITFLLVILDLKKYFIKK